MSEEQLRSQLYDSFKNRAHLYWLIFVDNGTFESAGFRFSADTYQPGGQGCCYLHIRSGSAE